MLFLTTQKTQTPHIRPVSFKYRALEGNDININKPHNTRKTGINKIKENWEKRNKNINIYLTMRS